MWKIFISCLFLLVISCAHTPGKTNNEKGEIDISGENKSSKKEINDNSYSYKINSLNINSINEISLISQTDLLVYFKNLYSMKNLNEEEKAEKKIAQKTKKEVKYKQKFKIAKASKNSSAELLNLNPEINKWFILKTGEKKDKNFHLENVLPENKLSLSQNGILITNEKAGSSINCTILDPSVRDIRKIDFNFYKNPHFPLCEGLVYLRLKRSSTVKLSLTEWATENLRKISFGENIINFVKPLIVASKAEAGGRKMIDFISNMAKNQTGPLKAQINKNSSSIAVSTQNHLGIKIINNDDYLEYGMWYQSKLHENIYVSLITPELIDSDILESYKDSISKSELNKLIYLTAYDMSKYSINYVHGTSYPGLPPKTDTNKSSIALSGSIPPYMISKSVGVFIGGFKRSHGTFKYGEHRGKTYGYIENGVVLSKMEKGLATIYSTKTGEIEITKWPEERDMENMLLKKIVSARQNGVMIIDNYKPGKHIYNWGHGNWSGDVNGNLRTLRSAVCIQENKTGKHLLFSAFTSATPGTMAKVLQSYKCKNAMQLDMNAYMYLHNALFDFDEKNNINIEYLHTEMEYPKGLKRHRFVMDNNNRDFFYVYKK
jgi:hypothetical protein